MMADTAPRGIQPHESPIYSRLSRLYDHSFGLVFQPRITRVVRSLGIPSGARVLEIGCGTGISFGAYPTNVSVVGIDLADDMLVRARRRIAANGWTHVRVQRGDAMALDFPDDSFDYVMAFHVISVVPDPIRMIREAQRVCRDGGAIVVINHFRSENPVLARMQRTIDPMTRRLGWTTLLRLGEVVRGGGLDVRRTWKTSTRSLFTIVEARNHKAPREQVRSASTTDGSTLAAS
jgi:phosphatidylethanolamine/phosphatidyl-N-methylethanolamine N-methyltransferase